MIVKQQFLNFLGIAQRAGKIISGEKILLKEIKGARIRFLIIASDAGSATSKKFHDKVRSHRIPFNDLFTTDQLSKAIGNRRVVLGINIKGFANHLIELNRKIKG